MEIFKIGKRKKGSMELSINAIVILIIAMTVLGLGITFIRSMFKSATGKLATGIENVDLAEQPSADKPITMPQTIEASRGGTVGVNIGFYNAGDQEITAQPAITNVCKGTYIPAPPAPPTPAETTTQPLIIAANVSVAAGTSTAFQTQITPPSSAKVTTYICTVSVGPYNKQFFLSVKG